MSKLRIFTTSAGFAIAFSLTALIAFAGLPIAASAGDYSTAVHDVDEDGVSKPVRLQGVGPAYPEIPREEKVEGEVLVSTVIDTNGRVRDPEVIKSIGPAFEEAVLGVLPKWQFEPATLDGKPVAVRYQLTFRFLLDSKKDEGEDAAKL